ncbi:hypothetical protein ACLKA6_002752 [Drosophila palustris]
MLQVQRFNCDGDCVPRTRTSVATTSSMSSQDNTKGHFTLEMSSGFSGLKTRDTEAKQQLRRMRGKRLSGFECDVRLTRACHKPS